MSIRLLIGPNGSPPQADALQAFRQFTPLQQHESVRFVVPGISQVLDLRRFVLSDESYGTYGSHGTHKTHKTYEFPGILGDPFCTFQRLAGEILGSRPITETQKRLLLGELPIPEYFGGSPNLPAALSAIIRTLKRSLVSPGDLQQAVVHLPETSQPKVYALAALYQSYEAALAERNLQDSEGILIQALAEKVPWELVIVDGFIRLYPIHMEFIRHLAERCDVLVTSDKPIDLPAATIEHLPPKTQNLQPKTLPSGADAVASEIKRLLREGFRLDEIAVIARDVRPYQQRIARTFDEYGIQLATEVYPLAGHSLDTKDRCKWTRKDCAAWKATQRIMSEIEAAEALFGRKLDSRARASAIGRATFRVSNGSGVTLSDMDMLGGRKFRVVFIIEAPERQSYEDPFLLDFERELLNPHLPRPLDLSTAGQDDSDMTSCATERVYLINPESQGDTLPTIEEAETLNALRHRTILDCFNAADEETKQTAAAAYNLLLEKGALGPEDFEPIPDEIGDVE